MVTMRTKYLARRSSLTTLVTLVLLLHPSSATARAPDDAAMRERATTMARAAEGWLALLDAPKRRLAAFRFDHPQRMRWQATPGTRIGLAWGRMDAAQQAAAETLLRTGLSQAGIDRFRGVVDLERILRRQAGRMVRRNPSWRDPGLYWLAIFGTPSPTGTWSWRLEGHHFSRHFTCVAGRVYVAPAFHGANPARTATGRRVLAVEEDRARDLVNALTETQRRTAVLRQAPRDFLPRAPRDLARMPAQGIALQALTPTQRATFWQLLDAYAEVLHPTLAKAFLERARSTRPETLRFAWLGDRRAGRPHGYRIQGPTVFLEYWQAGNHIHAVWRDPVDEYGRRAAARSHSR